MARHRRESGPERPARGFRPGKEPPHLRKKRAKEHLGDVSPAQERLISMFAERSPAEARKLIRRWTGALLGGAILLGALGVVLYAWTWLAGIVVHVVAVIVLALWWRLRRQREAFQAMADAVGGRPVERRRPKRR